MSMLQKMMRALSRASFISDKRKIELFPPFFLMRIKVLQLDQGWNHARIKLPLNWISANAMGNMYGGYQASLADPIPSMACVHKFPGYRVATKSLTINFIRVGSSDLTLHFDFDEQQAKAIAAELKEKGRATPTFLLTLVREDGKVCSEISNTVAIRPKGYVTHHEHREDSAEV